MSDLIKRLCPYCHEIILVKNNRTFSNHVRWCKSNPKYNEIKDSTKRKLLESLGSTITNKLGAWKIFSVKCFKCGKTFEVKEREKKFPSKDRYYCSRSCANKRIHSATTIAKIKEKIDTVFADKKLNGLIKPIFNHICKNCGKSFEDKSINRSFCSAKCYSEFRIRESKNKKETKFNYYNECKFQFSLNHYPNEFDFSLVSFNGWYKAKNHGNNLNGVSRDHMYSVKSGYSNHIDPYLISHPANCRLLSHSNNAKKHTSCSITLDDLINRVNAWNLKYGEYENKINYYKIEKFKKWE